MKEVVSDVKFVEGEGDLELRPAWGEVGRAEEGYCEVGTAQEDV